MNLDSLVRDLKTPGQIVSVKLEYSEIKGKTIEYGVNIRSCAPGQHGAACSYSSLHFHVAKTQSTIADASPEISAHFKAGRGKGVNQQFDLKPYDAYALYLQLKFFTQPTDKGFTRLNVRVTKATIQNMISSKDVRALKSVYIGKLFDLSFWDSDAWSLFLDWLTKG